MHGHTALITVLAGAMTILAAAARPAAAPAAPILGIAGPAFTIDGHPRFLLLVSYFDALRASDAALEADFAFLHRSGLDGVRIFPNWWRCEAERQCGGHPGPDTLFEPGTGRVRPDRLARLRQVLDRAGRHGLIVDVSFARETVRADRSAPALSPAAYVEGLASVLHALADGHPHVMIDLQNEIDQNRLFAADAAGDARQLAQLVERTVPPGRIVFASTNESEAELVTYCGTPGPCPASSRPLDVLAVHDARVAHWHDRTPAVVRTLRALGARRGEKPVYLQEPFAWQDERAADRRERFLDAAARARRAGAAAWTFHTRSAFILRDGRSLTAQLDPEQRAFLEQVRGRVDASAPAATK